MKDRPLSKSNMSRSNFFSRWRVPERCYVLFMINILFTLLVAALLVMTQSVWSQPSATTTTTSTSTWPFQGRLTNPSGEPLAGQFNFEFRIYDVLTGGTPLWEEYWTGDKSVKVSEGLLNVMLGSINNTLESAIAGHNELYLGITVGADEEMSPRVELGSVPFAMQALSVPDGAITTEKIASEAVTIEKLNLNGHLVLNGKLSTNNLDVAEMLKLKVDTNVYTSGIDHGPEVYPITNGGPACSANERGSIFVGRVSAQSTQDSLCVCMKFDDHSLIHSWWCLNP